MSKVWVLVVDAIVAAVIGGLISLKIESGRWRAARHQYAANLDQIKQVLGHVEMSSGIVSLTTPQVYALMHADANPGGHLPMLGGNFVIRRDGRTIRAYFCDASDPTDPLTAAYSLGNAGGFESLNVPSDPTNLSLDWNEVDVEAWARACAVNKS